MSRVSAAGHAGSWQKANFDLTEIVNIDGLM